MDISDESFDNQRDILESSYVEWRQDNEQVDDILVMGFGIDKVQKLNEKTPTAYLQ